MELTVDHYRNDAEPIRVLTAQTPKARVVLHHTDNDFETVDADSLPSQCFERQTKIRESILVRYAHTDIHTSHGTGNWGVRVTFDPMNNASPPIDSALLAKFAVVALSPHFDDVALSIGGHLFAIGGDVLVVTAHGGSPSTSSVLSDWDSDCGFTSGAEAYSARVREDKASCTALDAHSYALPVPDGPYVHDDDLDAVADVVLALSPGTRLYVPLGVAQPDHRRVRDTALEALAARTDVEVRLFADLPYAAADPGWSPRLSPPEEHVAGRLGEALRETEHQVGPLVRDCTEVLSGSAWIAKRAAVLAHASQLCAVQSMDEVSELGPLLGLKGPLSVEMIWRPMRNSCHRLSRNGQSR
jgi:LmbE family N-acetylglucosaminyl deacetylase